MKIFNISPSSSELWVWEMVVMSATQTGLCLSSPWKSSWMTHLNSSIHPSLAACSSQVVVTAYAKIHRLPSPWPLCPALLRGSHGTLRPTGRHRFSCVFWLFPYLVLLSVKGAAALRESQDSLQEKTMTKQEHRSTWDICLSALLLLECDRPTEISHHCWVSNRMVIPHPDTQPTKKKFQTMLKSERSHPLWNSKYNSVVWVCALHVPVCIALKV